MGRGVQQLPRNDSAAWVRAKANPPRPLALVEAQDGHLELVPVVPLRSLATGRLAQRVRNPLAPSRCIKCRQDCRFIARLIAEAVQTLVPNEKPAGCLVVTRSQPRKGMAGRAAPGKADPPRRPRRSEGGKTVPRATAGFLAASCPERAQSRCQFAPSTRQRPGRRRRRPSDIRTAEFPPGFWCAIIFSFFLSVASRKWRQ